VAFIGGAGRPSNAAAGLWLIQEIMPRVWARNPWIRRHIIGPGWTAHRLPQHDDRIEIAEAVGDLAEALDRVQLTVAPLRFGAGVTAEVVESFAAGTPCVMSPIAAEGLPLPDELEPLVAAGADAIADAIVRLHDDERALRLAADAGLATLAEHASEQCVIDALREALPPRSI